MDLLVVEGVGSADSSYDDAITSLVWVEAPRELRVARGVGRDGEGDDAETLERKGIENDPTREGAARFLTTGDPVLFKTLGERFLQLPIAEVDRVSLAELEAAAA